MMDYVKNKNIRLTLLIALALAISIISCHKEPEIIVEEPQLTLDQCGPLEYRHSMFIINNECWGVNEPPDAMYNNFYNTFSFKKTNKYEESLSFNQNKTDRLNNNIWKVIFGYVDIDAIYSLYGKNINLDTSSQLKIQYNSDNTWVTGTVKSLILSGGANFELGFPKEIIISEGSFRTSVIK
jgi:hypothetical protein